ncbi:MAG: DDE-type integrase/transposase/recombinase [Candidatus Woesearchaeota archaeon]
MVSAFQPQRAKNEGKDKNVMCRFCRSADTSKKGYRSTMNRGKIQRFTCRNCGKSFCLDEGFFRMRNNELKITKAIDLYFSNLSSRKVRNNYRRHEETKISHVSVLDWCRKYATKVYRFTEQFKPTLKGRYYADETFVKCEGRNDKFWVCLDWDSRFITNLHYSYNLDTRNEAIKFLQKIKDKNIPNYIQTDCANFYIHSFHHVFKNDYVEHRINNVSQTGKHNVRIETVFMKIKDRINDFRGFKATWSAPILLAGVVLQHNFIEDHTTTGVLPSYLAGIGLNLGVNRWLGLIKLSSVSVA